MEENKYFTGEDLRNYVYLMLSICVMACSLLWIFLFNLGPLGGGLLVLGVLVFLKSSRNIFFPHKYKKHMKHYATIIVVVALFVLVFMAVSLFGILFHIGNSPSI